MREIEITDSNYPKRLLEIKNPPKKLYVKGNYKLLNNDSIAIVGARECTEYGINHTKIFSKTIADVGITIISGLAIGIDTVAHDIAKECKGNTIAVLGCGLNYIYPEENRELAREILDKDGCIISEYESNTNVHMSNFPKRNRIISGIAMGILVIEAGYRSGSTITGRYGLEQNKKVFAIPRDIGTTNGIGTNNLIKMGANLVTKPEEILNEFKIETKQDNNLKNSQAKKELVKVKEKYQDIFSFILYTPISIQELVRKSKLPIVDIQQKLAILELEGHIKSLPGNFYVRS